MNKVCWVIAGATSAIAKCFAHIVAKQGCQLILLGRDAEKLAAQQADLQLRYSVDVDYILFDATQMKNHEAIAKECMQRAKGPIHLLVAFGYMLLGNTLEQSVQDSVVTVNSNYTGAVSLILSFVPYFKQQKKGSILVLGSVAGDRGRPSNFVYGSAKSGLAQFCEGLRAALYRDNVGVTLMRLGYIDTPLTYGKPGYFLAASPERCARACLRAAKRRSAQPYFPFFWRWIMLIFKCMPRFIFNRLYRL